MTNRYTSNFSEMLDTKSGTKVYLVPTQIYFHGDPPKSDVLHGYLRASVGLGDDTYQVRVEAPEQTPRGLITPSSPKGLADCEVVVAWTSDGDADQPTVSIRAIRLKSQSQFLDVLAY